MSAAPRKATSPLCPCRGLRRGRGGAPSLRFILSRCLLSLVLCPMEMQKGLTRPFWMRVPIPRAAWGGLQPRSSQRACVTFRVFKGWASRQSVGFDLALPRSSPAMHFLQVQRNQEACSCTAACHDLGWSGRRVQGRTGHSFPSMTLPTHLWLKGGREAQCCQTWNLACTRRLWSVGL